MGWGVEAKKIILEVHEKKIFECRKEVWGIETFFQTFLSETQQAENFSHEIYDSH